MTNLLFYNLLNNVLKRNLHHAKKGRSTNIPKRVKRDNLTILKELASTVKTDYRGTSYQFFDDPFLVPVSGMDKKVAMLSTQSGRNAARYVMQQHPTLFLHDTSFPPIKDFSPPPEQPTGGDVLTELQNCISLLQPLSAYAAYKKAIDQEVVIPLERLDDLLDLLCFSNSSSIPTQLPPDTRYFMEGVERDGVEDNMTEWQTDGPAEGIFQAISHPSLRNISAIIKGRCKFHAYESAYDEYHKLIMSKKKVTADVHDSILKILHHIKPDADELWNNIISILESMNDSRTTPTITTFNSALTSLLHQHPSHQRHYNQDIPYDILKMRFDQALNLVAEAVSCKLTPNLTTWWLFLEISYPNYKTRGSVVHNVIEFIANNNTPLQQHTDFEFFECAMSKCLKNVQSVEAAKKLHAVVMEGGLEGMLGANNKKSSYFTHYMMTLIQHDNIDNTFNQYYNIVPHMYTPSFKVMTSLLNAIELQCAYNHLPHIWKDMVSFRYHRRTDLLTSFLAVMARSPKHDSMELEYTDIMDALFKMYLTDLSIPHLHKPLQLFGNQVTDMMMIYLKANQHHKAWVLLMKFVQTSKTSCGIVKEEPLSLLIQHYIKEDDFDKCISILRLMQEYGLVSVEVFVEEACNIMQLTQQQKIDLKNVLCE